MREQRASASGRLPHHPGAVCGGPVESGVVVSVRLQLTESHRGSVLAEEPGYIAAVRFIVSTGEGGWLERSSAWGVCSVRCGIRIGGLILDRGVCRGLSGDKCTWKLVRFEPGFVGDTWVMADIARNTPVEVDCYIRGLVVLYIG